MAPQKIEKQREFSKLQDFVGYLWGDNQPGYERERGAPLWLAVVLIPIVIPLLLIAACFETIPPHKQADGNFGDYSQRGRNISDL